MEKDGSIWNEEDGIDPKELEDYKLVRSINMDALLFDFTYFHCLLYFTNDIHNLLVTVV